MLAKRRSALLTALGVEKRAEPDSEKASTLLENTDRPTGGEAVGESMERSAGEGAAEGSTETPAGKEAAGGSMARRLGEDIAEGSMEGCVGEEVAEGGVEMAIMQGGGMRRTFREQPRRRPEYVTIL